MSRRVKGAKELSSLFLAQVPKQDLPERDASAFLRLRKEHRKQDREHERQQHEIEESEAAVYRAKLKTLGLTPESFSKILKQASQTSQHARSTRVFAQDVWHQSASVATVFGPVLEGVDCRDITIRVCKDRVCVDQPVTLPVDGIWLEAGSDGSFTKLGSNTFTASDSVEGSSKWNWTYHRYSQTHEGQITVWSSTKLAEDAGIRGFGLVFEHLLQSNGSPRWNGACAHGKDPVGLPPSWGWAQMFRQFKVKYKKPGSGWTPWFDGAREKYTDLGPVESNIACWVDNVLGNWGRYEFYVSLPGQFPKDTEFLIESYLSYWIKGNGGEGRASVYYNLEVRPYINFGACSYEYPEWISVHVPDYVS